MIIYLYGADSYRRQEKLKAIVAKYREKHSGLTIEKFFLDEESELEKLKDFLTTQSLFGFNGKKMGIVYLSNTIINDSAIMDDSGFREMAQFLADNKMIFLIINAESILSKRFNFLLKKPVLSQKFDELKPAQMAVFIKKEAEKRGLKLSPNQITGLIRANRSGTWGIVNDLDILALGGKLEDSAAAPDFWGLLNRIRPAYAKASAGKGGDLAALTWLLENEESAKIFNLLASQADADLKIKMADYDIAIKSGKLEYEEALVDLVI